MRFLLRLFKPGRVVADIPSREASGPKGEPEALGQFFCSLRDRKFRNGDLWHHPSLQTMRREFLDEAA